MSKSKQLSRRAFAHRAAAAAGALTVAPAALLGREVSAPTAAAKAGAAAAVRRRQMGMPPEVVYGGLTTDGREVRLEDTLTPAGQAPPDYPGGWKEGTTMPAEYYTDERHYVNDERAIAEHFWLMADHESRIPKPGDYFVFEFGRGDSMIVVRGKDGTVKGFHNVCRHRGSRLVLHGFDKNLPTGIRPDGKPIDPRMSVAQLGPAGTTQVIRCPYHAWTYDIEGKLISFPPGMPQGFDAAQYGLHPAHVRTVEGFIFISFSRREPPEFDSFVANWRTVCQRYKTATLRVAARKQYPTRANWKLAVENFVECYHCQPAHSSLVRVQWWQRNPITPEQRTRTEAEFARHGHAAPPRPRAASASSQPSANDRLVPPVRQQGMGGLDQHLSPGFVTGTLDGKPVAPPILGEWTHRRSGASTGFSTSFFAAYDDHLAVARFTPRDVASTDVEIFWLVRGDAKEKEVDVERMMGLWDVTYQEDRWIVENNQHGIRNSRFNLDGGQPYAASEGGPAGFVKWYMKEVVPHA